MMAKITDFSTPLHFVCFRDVLGAISSIHTMFQPVDLYSNTILTDKPKLSPITPFKRIPQSRIGEGGPDVNANTSIADDPLVIIAPSTSGVDNGAVLAHSSEYQILESARRAFVQSRSGVVVGSGSSGSSESASAYKELEQKYAELEAKLAAMMTPVVPVVSTSDISAALSGLRTSSKRRKA